MSLSQQAKTSPWFWLAVFFGSGLAPKAPGTFGTLASLLLWIPLLYLELLWWQLVIIIVVISVVGTVAAQKASEILNNEDPKEVVIDEVAGQGIALLFCPLGWPWFVAAFVFFRFFDILKPWPVGWIDKNLHGGLGIMADDLVAGLYALGCVQLLLYFLG